MRPAVEISIGVVLLAFVSFMFYESFNPLYEGFGQPEFPPMRFPRWILMAIGGLTILHFIRVGFGMVKTEPLFSQTLWRRVAMVGVASLVAALLIQPLGFAIASMLGFWAIAALIGYRNYRSLSLITIFFVVAVWALFTFIINIGLPNSPFFYRF